VTIAKTHALPNGSWEIAALPVTLPLVNAIKRREGVDDFDIGTNFNPLRFRASVARTPGTSVISNVGNLRESSTLDQGQWSER